MRKLFTALIASILALVTLTMNKLITLSTAVHRSAMNELITLHTTVHRSVNEGIARVYDFVGTKAMEPAPRCRSPDWDYTLSPAYARPS